MLKNRKLTGRQKSVRCNRVYVLTESVITKFYCNLYRGSKRSFAAKLLLQYSPCSLDPWMAATYRHINMKAVARYQIILLGKQRHTGVNNLPKVVAWQCSGQELNPRPLDFESDSLTITPPSHHSSESKTVSSATFYAVQLSVFRCYWLASVHCWTRWDWSFTGQIVWSARRSSFLHQWPSRSAELCRSCWRPAVWFVDVDF